LSYGHSIAPFSLRAKEHAKETPYSSQKKRILGVERREARGNRWSVPWGFNQGKEDRGMSLVFGKTPGSV